MELADINETSFMHKDTFSKPIPSIDPFIHPLFLEYAYVCQWFGAGLFMQISQQFLKCDTPRR